MADSNITKKALASALRELMNDIPFEKINISQICERCQMNRKSFYYHFRDKYDLLNWIFDTEFIMPRSWQPIGNGWDYLTELCNYLYSNVDFYRKALKVSGQNSFYEHFRETQLPIISVYVKALLGGKQEEKFYIDFFADGFLAAIVRWVSDKNCMPPERFIDLLQACVNTAAVKVYNDSKFIQQ